MIDTLTFPAFRNNGVALHLSEVLSAIPDNNLVWSLVEFSGMGKAPDNLSMDEFENKIRMKPGGLIMSWQKLKEVANKLDQTIDCLIVGAKTDQDILNAYLIENHFFSCEIILRVFDSTEWSVWSQDTSLMKKIAAVY